MNNATRALIINDKNYTAKLFAFYIRYTRVLMLRLIETSARKIRAMRVTFDSDVNSEFRNRTAVA